MARKLAALLLAGLLLCAAAWFVWPTPYIYSRADKDLIMPVTIRTNRFTGVSEFTYGSGWQPMRKMAALFRGHVAP